MRRRVIGNMMGQPSGAGPIVPVTQGRTLYRTDTESNNNDINDCTSTYLRYYGDLDSQSTGVLFEYGGTTNGFAVTANNGVLRLNIAAGAQNCEWTIGTWSVLEFFIDVNDIKIFVDGVQVSAKTYSTVSKVAGGDDIGIGEVGNVIANGYLSNANFNGAIEKVELYDTTFA